MIYNNSDQPYFHTYFLIHLSCLIEQELDRNVALKVYETDSADTYEICGRGQLHLTVLIENMRREGFEVMVGPPTVIDRVVNGVKC